MSEQHIFQRICIAVRTHLRGQRILTPLCLVKCKQRCHLVRCAIAAVPVRNSSDSDYNGTFAIIFHDDDDADQNPVLTLTSEVQIAADSKDTAYVTGTLTNALVPGNTYIGVAHYLGLDGYEKIRTNALKVSNKFSITAQTASVIEPLSSDEVSSGPCYNLRGQRVSPDARGLIIRNGKIIFKH